MTGTYDTPMRINSKLGKKEKKKLAKKHIPMSEWPKMFNTFCKYKQKDTLTQVKEMDSVEFEKNLDKTLANPEFHNFVLNYYQVLLYHMDGGKYWSMMRLNDDEYELLKDLPYETLINGDQKVLRVNRDKTGII